MADQVQYILDRMAPVMVELKRLKIFNMQEVKQIIKSRRDNEYILKRRQLKVQDFLQYLEHEMNLETLRRTRMKRLNIPHAGKAEGHGIRHISYIFERAVRRFPKDIKLWEAYLDFLQKHNSKSIFSSVLMRAIHLHPREEQLWIKAATMETVNNNNSHAARVLMQRAIRINPHSKLLWLFYFKQEVFEALRVRKRRKTLGLSVEADAEGEEGEDTAGLRSLLRGEIPCVVFRHACSSVPVELEFMLQFHMISHAARDELPLVHATVEERIKEDFAESPEMYLRLGELKLRNTPTEESGGVLTGALHGANAQRKRRRTDAAAVSLSSSTEDMDAALELLQQGLDRISGDAFKAGVAGVVIAFLKQDATNLTQSHMQFKQLLSDIFSSFSFERESLSMENSATIVKLASLNYEFMLLLDEQPESVRFDIGTNDPEAVAAASPVVWLLRRIQDVFAWFGDNASSTPSSASAEEQGTAVALSTAASTCLKALQRLTAYLAMRSSSQSSRAADRLKHDCAQIILGLSQFTCKDSDAKVELVYALDEIVDADEALRLCRGVVDLVATTCVDASLVCFWCTEYLRRALQLQGLPSMLAAHDHIMKNTFAGAAAASNNTDESSPFLDYFEMVVDTIMAHTSVGTTGKQQEPYELVRQVYEQALRVCKGADRQTIFDSYAHLEIRCGHPERANQIRWRAQKDSVAL